MRRTRWARKARLYTIDAVDIAHDLGLGNRINMITQAAFFKISGIMDLDSAVRELKHSIEVTYGNKGQDVVDKNKAAVDLGLSKIRQVAIPDSWANAVDDAAEEDAPDYVKNVIRVMGRQEGDQLPVSTFLGMDQLPYTYRALLKYLSTVSDDFKVVLDNDAYELFVRIRLSGYTQRDALAETLKQIGRAHV